MDAHRSWRKVKVTAVKVTARRAAGDLALGMRELSDLHFPEAKKIRVVMDKLSSHAPAPLYKAFPAPEARRILKRLQFHFTPKHAGWLDKVEIEIGVLPGQCLHRRIEDKGTLCTEIAAREKQRNQSGARINWTFSSQTAQAKLPKPNCQRQDGASLSQISGRPGKPIQGVTTPVQRL